MAGLRGVGGLVLGIVLAGAASGARAQLIPLLPPVAEPGEEATPQESRSAQLVQAELEAEKFDELDELAGRLRTKKGRNAGGGWKLRAFYTALDPKEPNDDAVKAHLAHLEHWIAAKPESITARVALAQSLIDWGWQARGNGMGNTVTPAMAKLFFARVEQAQKVLEEAKSLKTMCPQWYSEMLTVGLAEGWDKARMQALFDEGTAFEPGYLYLYREYANYLLPKWEGQPGDAAKFATAMADKLGGDDGDLIYFDVATVVIKRGNGGIPTQQMDWARIKRGALVLDKRYGQSRQTTNQLAFMAYKYQDAALAGQLFRSIGDRWAPAVWKEKANFERARNWAARASGGTDGTDAGKTGAAVE
jgi:hypothetical protein